LSSHTCLDAERAERERGARVIYMLCRKRQAQCSEAER